MAYFEMAYSVMTYLEMAYFEMEYFEMAYFLKVWNNKTRLQPSWMEPSTLRPMIRDTTNCSHVEEKVYYYFVWFPLTECKVLSASRRLFSLLWSRVAALEAAAKRLVLQILNWKNLPGVQVFLYVLSSLYVLFCLNPRKYWIERISQGSRFLFMFFIRYMSYSV